MVKINNVYSYNPKSEGAALIADALGIKRIRHENSRFKGNSKKVILNWGCSNLPEEVAKCTIINKSKAVHIASHKLRYFEAVKKEVSIPPFTTDIKEAMGWITGGYDVCARLVLQGSGAEGLIIMTRNNMDSFVKAPLYTKYIPKVDEYRIHVVNKAITDVQRKALRSSWKDENPGKEPNFKVRNLENGFIYMRNGVEAPPCVIEQAIKAVTTIGLDFGAVDIIYNNKLNQAFVLEVNCAPGIENTSVVNYAAAFKDM